MGPPGFGPLTTARDQKPSSATLLLIQDVCPEVPDKHSTRRDVDASKTFAHTLRPRPCASCQSSLKTTMFSFATGSHSYSVRPPTVPHFKMLCRAEILLIIRKENILAFDRRCDPPSLSCAKMTYHAVNIMNAPILNIATKVQWTSKLLAMP